MNFVKNGNNTGATLYTNSCGQGRSSCKTDTTVKMNQAKVEKTKNSQNSSCNDSP